VHREFLNPNEKRIINFESIFKTHSKRADIFVLEQCSFSTAKFLETRLSIQDISERPQPRSNSINMAREITWNHRSLLSFLTSMVSVSCISMQISLLTLDSRGREISRWFDICIFYAPNTRVLRYIFTSIRKINESERVSYVSVSA